ncbi:MAG: formylglycine-generating enzyme family protein [Myxococcales bacterium]
MPRPAHFVPLTLCLLACRKGPAQDSVEVPAAVLPMGCDPARDPGCNDDERPLHLVQVARFRIDRTEVTQAAYAACIAARACRPPAGPFEPAKRPRRPVTDVTWEQARDYCRWLGRRLPGEAEWELAARGTDGRLYPWGDAPPSCARAHTSDCGEDPADVGGRPAGASPYGVLDMAGNVDEWVEDPYRAYGQAPTPASGQRVARGGAVDAWHSRSTCRNALAPSAHDGLLGFRCAG